MHDDKFKFSFKTIPESWIKKSEYDHSDEGMIIELIVEIIYLHLKSNAIGILGLYDDLELIIDPFFEKSLKYALDGFPPNHIDYILSNNINASNESGSELRKKIIIKDGIISLTINNNTDNAIALLLSLSHASDHKMVLNMASAKWESEKYKYFKKSKN